MTNGTTETTAWFWVVSVGPCLLRICVISGSGRALPSIPQIPRTVLTYFSQSSGGPFPIHLGRNTHYRRGFHWKPGVSSTPGLWHDGARMVYIRALEHSAVILRRFFRETGSKGWPRQDPRWIPSSLLFRL